jgi:diguanylate cyclase (GGDEF)-like protein
MARCERTGEQLSAVYLDVIGLKALNDSEGHAAGDELLQRVVTLVRTHVRPYDLVIRLGGDEFLCVMHDVRLAFARSRFAAIAAELAAAAGPGAIRTGFALLRAGESAAALIARADGQLVDSKRAASNGGGRSPVD